MHKGIYAKLALFTNLFLILSLLTPVFAQAKRGGGGSVAKKAAPATEKSSESCGVWTGTIEYVEHKAETNTKVTAKGQHMSDQHYSGVAEVKTSWDYKGKFVVSRSSGGDKVYDDGSSLVSLKGSLTADAARVQDEKDNWITQTDCFPDKPQFRFAGKDSFSNITEKGSLPLGRGDGVLNIQANGRYSISFGFPQIEGRRVHKQNVKPFGWCQMDQNPPHDSAEESAETFSGERVEFEGQLDPKNPNIIKGSLRPDEDTTIVWNLTRTVKECDEPLEINGLRLAHHVFPNKTEWQDLDDKTVDGNQVRITANVINEGKKAKSGTVVFKEKKSGEVLGEKAVTVPAEGEKEVEFVWDTNGYAWTEDGKEASDREIEASVTGGSSDTVELTVVPKPVILVHGLWSNAAAWAPYNGFLKAAHSEWKGYAVGADTSVAMMSTGKGPGNWEPTFSIRQNAAELGKQIKHTQTTENAWRVDIVAHSMGGLISRYYIHHSMVDTPDGNPTIKHLVMLGTPNMGSPCAVNFYEKYKLLGFEVEALRELMPSVVAGFNQQVTNRKNVRFSITYTDRVPVTCDVPKAGDGVVTRDSAIWEIADRSLSDSLEHTSLTGKDDFVRYVKPRIALGPKMAK